MVNKIPQWFAAFENYNAASLARRMGRSVEVLELKGKYGAPPSFDIAAAVANLTDHGFNASLVDTNTLQVTTVVDGVVKSKKLCLDKFIHNDDTTSIDHTTVIATTSVVLYYLYYFYCIFVFFFVLLKIYIFLLKMIKTFLIYHLSPNLKL